MESNLKKYVCSCCGLEFYTDFVDVKECPNCENADIKEVE